MQAPSPKPPHYNPPPATRKGAVRARIAEMVLQANRDGQVKTVQWFGSPNMPHTFTYVPDFGKALVELGVDGMGWGEVWHVPQCITCSGRDAALATAKLVNKPAKMTPTGKWMLHIVGLFMPAAKEMIEMLPHFETPYVVDDGKWHSRMYSRATPWNAALALTVATYQK